jgi:hypothetical protein
MFRTFFNTCGVSIATLALGLSLVATPVMAMGGGGFHGGGGGFHGGGGGFHGGGFHGGGFGGFHAGGFHGGGFHGGGFHGGGFHAGGFHGGGFHGDGFHDRGFGRFRGGFGVLGWPYYAYPYGSDYYPDYGSDYYPDYGYGWGQYGNSYTWYYCSDPAGYYPYVAQCNTGWQAVPAS